MAFSPTAVGRAGGLAVALGIGLGIGLGTAALAAAAPAWADDSRGDRDSVSSPARRSADSAGTADSAGPRSRAVAARTPAASATSTTSATARRGRSAAPPTVSTAAVAQPRLMLTPTGQGRYPLKSGSTGAAELSGITYGGGSTYYAVGDNGATSIFQLATVLAAGFGWVNSATIAGGISAPGMGSDAEGIALRPGTGTAWIADESTSTIGEFSLATGARVGAVPVPEIYRPANVQNNFGLEALSFGAGRLWTANEEALKSDGALSTTRSGTWVRLQEFGGEDVAALAQYAYRTERISALSPFTTAERSGLVDLLALPDGRVLALERELGGFLPSFRSRVYLLDFTGATDVSALPSLADGGFTPVAKRLIWQSVFLTNNFEGITLGPRLDDGTYSVLLISDDGAGEARQRQDLFTLVLRGVRDPVSVL